MPTPATKPGNEGVVGCALLVGGIILVLLIGQCSGDTANSNALEAMNTANADMSNSIAAQTPPPVEPLNAASVSRGGAHYRTAFAAEAFPGAMIYSQNCYDALSREFTWAKLDQCGGFDMLAVRAIDVADMSVPTSERDYFQSEAAAGRYLAAATGAGEPATDADQRLSQLQARAARERAPARPRPAAANDDAATNMGAIVNDALEVPMDDAVGG